MLTLESVKPTIAVHKRCNTHWINPARAWITPLYKSYYQEWRDLAQSLLPQKGTVLDECEDVVNEAIVDTLNSIHDGCVFDSQDQLNMHIKRTICLFCLIVDTETCWA